MTSTLEGPTWQRVMWQPEIVGRTRDIPIHCFAGPEPASTHFYPGYGEERRATERGVRLLSQVGVHAAGVLLPFNCLEPNAANLRRTIAD